jgi:hypothetical protein
MRSVLEGGLDAEVEEWRWVLERLRSIADHRRLTGLSVESAPAELEAVLVAFEQECRI